MINELELFKDQKLSAEDFRKMIIHAEDELIKRPETFNADSGDCPLKHTFLNGLYIREILMPEGMIIISKLHLKDNPYFVLSGMATISTEDGIILIEAPYHGITKAGTKRALFIHEDMVWITVHPTDKTDVKEVEKEIFSDRYIDMEV